jgi:tetratricopeptide (TPR) repeat protein
VTDYLDEVLALKASAKTARDDSDWQEAISDLQEAIDLLRSQTPEAPRPLPSQLASELSDTYGLIGGIHKRWGLNLDGEDRRRHLKESVDAYDEGFWFEQVLPPNDANTYNRVNRLVGRVLLDPAVLDKGSGTIADDLQEAENILTEEIRSVRQKDPWAYCDLGTVRLLRGESNALSAFRQLDRLRPPTFVYDSALTTLEPLSEVASGLRPELPQAVNLLQRLRRYSE